MWGGDFFSELIMSKIKVAEDIVNALEEKRRQSEHGETRNEKGPCAFCRV